MRTTDDADTQGLESYTQCFVLARFQDQQKRPFSILKCVPKTGRQHQIRVHLAALQYPIVGDKLYSVTDEEAYQFFDRKQLQEETVQKMILTRHALHAAEIVFEHPVLKKELTVKAPWPIEWKPFLSHCESPHEAERFESICSEFK